MRIYQVLLIDTEDFFRKSYQSVNLDEVLDESYADYCILAKNLFEDGILVDCKTKEEFQEHFRTRESWLGDGYEFLETHYEDFIFQCNEFEINAESEG